MAERVGGLDPRDRHHAGAVLVRFTAGDREYAYAVTLLSQHVDVKYADVPLGQELMRTIHAYFTHTYR